MREDFMKILTQPSIVTESLDRTRDYLNQAVEEKGRKEKESIYADYMDAKMLILGLQAQEGTISRKIADSTVAEYRAILTAEHIMKEGDRNV